MSFFFPLGLLGFLGIPVLLWLWRLSETKRQTIISSLVPFERLQIRPPRKRARLITNLLFWLQLAACVALALAMSRPLVHSAAAKTVLVIVDTSASLQAVDAGARVFDEGLYRLRARMASFGPATRWFVMASAPVEALTPQPVVGSAAVEQAARSFGPQDLAGSLAAASQIGQALLGHAPHATLVMTDEPRPDGLAPGVVEWIPAGKGLPNAALIGVDAQPPLCGRTESRLVAVVENFSHEPASATLYASQGVRRLAEQALTLEPGARLSVPLAIPEEAQGWVRVVLDSRRDALSLDNQAQALIRRTSAVPVVVVSDSEAFRSTLGKWLDACEGLKWSFGAAGGAGSPHVLVTDALDTPDTLAVGVIRFVQPQESEPVQPAFWLIEPDHAIGRYMAQVEPAGVRPVPSAVGMLGGEPIVWALVRGNRVPVVTALEQAGRREVNFSLQAESSADSSQALVAFFNSLRWVIGGSHTTRTGEPLTVAGLSAGEVSVTRPDGTIERLAHDGGLFRYDATHAAGSYRIAQGGKSHIVAVNFFDPLESDLRQRASSWRSPAPGSTAAIHPERPARIPIAPGLLWGAVGLLLFEWWRYSARGGGRRR
jgi:hypothetical protein